MSAYMLWLNANREKIKSDHPGISITDLSKKAGELWKAMSKEKKEVWDRRAELGLGGGGRVGSFSASGAWWCGGGRPGGEHGSGEATSVGCWVSVGVIQGAKGHGAGGDGVGLWGCGWQQQCREGPG